MPKFDIEEITPERRNLYIPAAEATMAKLSTQHRRQLAAQIRKFANDPSTVPNRFAGICHNVELEDVPGTMLAVTIMDIARTWPGADISWSGPVATIEEFMPDENGNAIDKWDMRTWNGKRRRSLCYWAAGVLQDGF